jgi:UDP-N-acetylmuramate: L-alanyl-gamma-D-glutamyl-meso-diaminopimelate ligase
VEFDHADIYADLPAVQTAFRRLLGLIPRRGTLIAGAESGPLRELLPGAPCRVETFGLGAGCDWSAEAVASGPDGSRFRLRVGGRDRGGFRTTLAGEHNVRNCLGALAAAAAVGLEPEEARAALRAFQGVKRRLELRGRVAGTALYDDFAHHPTAVRETLRALRALDPPVGDGRVFAVFEPRSYTSRTRVFQDDFGRALASADRVIVAAAHLPGKVPEGQRVSEEELVAAARACGAEARFIPGVEAIVAALADEVRAGDRIAILSNGAFGRIHERLLEALRRRTPGPATPAVV